MNDRDLQQSLRATIDSAAAPVPGSEARLRAGARPHGLLAPRLGWSRLRRPRVVIAGLHDPGSGQPRVNPSGVWLDEEEPSARRHSRVTRRMVGALAAVVCVAIVAVPVGLVLTSTGSGGPPAVKFGKSGAKNRVLSALSSTIASGSFDMTYDFGPMTGTPANASTSPTVNGDGAPAPCVLESSGKTVCTGSALDGLNVTGQGTIDTDPFAMVALSDVASIGPVVLRDDGTDVWEIGGGNYGLSPGSSDSGPGSPLSGFAGLVEGSLGPREGGLAMMGLASPTGYLELDQDAITSASEVGTGVVDGAPVTIYQVSLDPAQEATVPGTTPDEAAGLKAALSLLQQQGYTGTTVKVSIDDAGYIRQTVSVAGFNDGVTQTQTVTFSDFGCAGKVLMPGQQGATAPPAGCVSPDTATSTTATTVVPSTTAATSSTGVTATTAAPGSTGMGFGPATTSLGSGSGWSSTAPGSSTGSTGSSSGPIPTGSTP